MRYADGILEEDGKVVDDTIRDLSFTSIRDVEDRGFLRIASRQLLHHL